MTDADDWLIKGLHVRIDGVELAMRTDHRGRIVFKKVFRSTSDEAEATAATAALALLTDPVWRKRFRDRISWDRLLFLHLLDPWNGLDRGRQLEFHYLRKALDRMETR